MIRRGRNAAVITALVLLIGSFLTLSSATAAVPTHSSQHVDVGPLGVCNYSGSHPTISYGSGGSAVAHAQCLLRNVWGYSYVAVDGIFGNQTKGAVEDHQEDCKILSDGIVGPDTWKNLHPDTAKSAC